MWCSKRKLTLKLDFIQVQNVWVDHLNDAQVDLKDTVKPPNKAKTGRAFWPLCGFMVVRQK